MQLAGLYLDALQRAAAARDLESRTQCIFFEERCARIDASKMELLEGGFAREHRMSDNLFRFIQVGIAVDAIVIDLPNTILSVHESQRLFSRGFTVDTSNSFKPLQKFHPPMQIEAAVVDLIFIWRDVFFLPSIPQFEIYAL